MVLAPAKLNLLLEVTGKRPNGYHELYSLCAFLNLADELDIIEAQDVRVSGANIADNIILKAAHKLKEKCSVPKGCHITITKNIPMGAGLGGGSADAAATLIALNKLWNLNLLPDDLYKIGLELGADVPVCLYSQLNVANAAFFSGIGEVITPAPMLPQIYFVLVNPNIHLATQDVFRSYQGNFSNYKNFDVSDNFIEALKARSNDLEQAAGALCPEISTALESLLHQNGCALSRMTGSGSTCFGIFLNQEEARFAAKEISTQHPKWFVKTAELI